MLMVLLMRKKIKQVIKQVCRIIGQGKPQFGKIKYRKDENMKVYPIINKAHTELKWKPKIDFDKGIKIVINSFSTNFNPSIRFLID